MEQFKIVRSESGTRVTYSIFEEGVTWESGEPRSVLDVEVMLPYDAFNGLEPAGVSWPSTSDKRPSLAKYVAQAIGFAAAEAEEINDA